MGTYIVGLLKMYNEKQTKRKHEDISAFKSLETVKTKTVFQNVFNKFTFMALVPNHLDTYFYYLPICTGFICRREKNDLLEKKKNCCQISSSCNCSCFDIFVRMFHLISGIFFLHP